MGNELITTSRTSNVKQAVKSKREGEGRKKKVWTHMTGANKKLKDQS
jgi:hypothetical protein